MKKQMLYKTAMTLVGVSLLLSCRKDEGALLPQAEKVDELELGSGYVDMGLSVKWAAMNFGASEVTDAGEYYQWACTEPVEGPVFEKDYKFISASTGDYNSDYFVGDDVKAEDDAVAVAIGGGVRMPNVTEARELVDNCTWRFVRYRGTVGYVATSKINGNSIFFPCGGYYADEGLINASFSVNIWVGSMTFEYSDLAYALTASPIVKPGAGYAHRYLAMPLRAVK